MGFPAVCVISGGRLGGIPRNAPEKNSGQASKPFDFAQGKLGIVHYKTGGGKPGV